MSSTIKPTIPGALPDLKDMRVVTPQEIAELERAKRLSQARTDLEIAEAKFQPPPRTLLESSDPEPPEDDANAPDPFSAPRPRQAPAPAAQAARALTSAPIKPLDEFYGFTLPDGVDTKLLASLEAKAGLRTRKLFELKWSLAGEEEASLTFALRVADYDDWQMVNRALTEDRAEDEQIELQELMASMNEMLACVQVVSIDDNLLVDMFGYGAQCRQALGLAPDAKLQWQSVPRGYAMAASLRMSSWLRVAVEPDALVSLVAFATKVRAKQVQPIESANPI